MIKKMKRVGVIFALLAGMFCSMGAGWLDRESIPVDQKGVANGVATLDGTVKIPISQLPTGAVNNVEDGTVTGQLIYWDHIASEWKHTEITELFWDDVNKGLGIGGWFTSAQVVNSAGSKVQIQGDINSGLSLFGANNSSFVYPFVKAFRARGTLASPTSVQTGNLLFGWGAYGYESGTGKYAGPVAGMSVEATGNFTSTTNTPVRISFVTHGSATINPVITFGSDGHVYIGQGGGMGLDNVKTFHGAGGDASIYYDGTDFIINPKEVGSGLVKILGGVSVVGADGIDYNPGSDIDVDLITIGVTGTPKVWWDEGDDSFRINKTVAIDNSGDGAVLLSLDSTTKGFLPSRMTAVQRDAIPFPPQGLMLYDWTNSKLDYFDGTVWKAFVSTDISTFVDGSIPFATGPHHISDDPDDFVWKTATKRLGIGTDTPLYRTQIEDSVGAANVGLLINNTNNASNLAFAQLTLESGGASGGDPRVRFAVNGVGAADWTVGVDNSDSDKFKISSSNKLETSTRVTIDPTSGNVGINVDPLTRLHMKNGQLVLDNGSYPFALTKVNSQGVAWSGETTLPSIIFQGKAGDRPEISFYRGSGSAPEFSIREHTTADKGAEIYSGNGVAAPTMTMAFYLGKVGIGTNIPVDPLHVVGNARIVGDIINIGDISMTGNLTSDGTVSGANVETSGKIYHTSIVTFTDADTTPTVGTNNIFKEENIDATSITAFDNGVTSQIITIIFTTGNTTIVDGANLHLSGGANFVGTADDTLQLVRGASDWFEVSRSVN